MFHPAAQSTSRDVTDRSNLHEQQRNAPKPRNGGAMARTNTRNAMHSERRSSDDTRAAITKATKSANAPAAHLPPDDRSFGKKKDEGRDLYKSPTTGRNTKLGRKVEKPQDPKAGGPSGQRDKAKHDKKHANK